jgi:hypothetical protein
VSQIVISMPPVALTIAEAAAVMGVSESTFRRHCLPHLRVLRHGTTVTVPVAELMRYADRRASMAGGTHE